MQLRILSRTSSPLLAISPPSGRFSLSLSLWSLNPRIVVGAWVPSWSWCLIEPFPSTVASSPNIGFRLGPPNSHFPSFTTCPKKNARVVQRAELQNCNSLQKINRPTIIPQLLVFRTEPDCGNSTDDQERSL